MKMLLSGTVKLCRGECEVSSENILAEKPPTFVDMGKDYNDEPVTPKFKIGGSEALYSSIRGLSSVDDEWIIIEPFYPKFEQHVRLANDIPRFTTLIKYVRNNSDRTKLCSYEESAVNNKTRGFMFNNLNNPLGKTYNRSEFEFIAELVEKHNLLVISDEVYEFTTDSMIRMDICTVKRQFPNCNGNFIHTDYSISSRNVQSHSGCWLSKQDFQLPGWRIGWAYEPENHIKMIANVHSEIVGSASLPQQADVSYFFDSEAITSGLTHKIFEEKLASVKHKREFMIKAFRNAGMAPIVPQGGYCMLTCWPKMKDGSNLAELVHEKIHVKGLSAVEYYSENHKNLGVEYVRLCYNKSNKTLENAAKKLMQLNDLEQYAKQGMSMSDIRKLVLEIFYSTDAEPSIDKVDELKSTDSL